jgi:dihydrofolate synthase/folylpolyglutamate synthase
MIESIALQAGWRVGLYQKPELVHFEERCRLDGRPMDAARLLPHFEAVERARGAISLTKFEFTTLAIARTLSLEPLDLVILEVGLGGRYDAVNAFDTDCAVITSIDLDHMEWLGPDRESIGLEKAQVMRPGRPAIVSDPVPPASVVGHAQAIGADLWLLGRDYNHSGDRQQWSWSGRGRRYNGMAYPALRGANQLLNASGAIAVFEALRDRVPVTAQAVRNGLAMVELPGRFQIVPGRPTLVLDVAHNPHSVAALAENLDQMGFYPRTHAVLGAMRDKDLAGMLQRLRPLVDRWYCTDLPTPRAASAQELAERVAALLPAAASGAAPATSSVRAPASAPGTPSDSVTERAAAAVTMHGSPAEALHAAIEAADPADRIVVFGSFFTVGGVLAGGLPRLGAPHVA